MVNRLFTSKCFRVSPQIVRNYCQSSASELKAYSVSIEAPLCKKWSRDSKARSAKNDLSGGQVVFSTILPPPNVTGTLHLGHALTVSIADAVCRWRRMSGHHVLWIPGTDHAGIATQSVVEKELLARNLTRHDLGRDKFIREVVKWKNSKGVRIGTQLRRLGATLDWSREFFTMDERRSIAVTQALIRLWDSGLVYRAESMINWCCHLRSAISDIEVDHLPVDGPTLLALPGYDSPVTFGQMDYFTYRVENSEEEIPVATTRLETMLGDVAVAVHPSDERYTRFHGKFLRHPFSNERLPIVVDESVNPEFGTGAVKITPAHDINDFNISKRHGLILKSVISEEGTIISDCAQFSGMKRFEAREAVRAALANLGSFKETRPHKTSLPICSRSGDVLESLLKPQWFINSKGMAKKALDALEKGELVIEPENYHKDWFAYLENIRDWCISRQLWWGHQVPFYNCTNGRESIWVAAESLDSAKMKASNQIAGPISAKRDCDVLDTWFSSGLLPFSCLGWPDQDGDFEKFYPLSTLITGHDILFFWVARMTMLGLELTGQLPFKKVLLHSIVCDSQGKKMSKSLGNIIDPMDVINGCSLKELNLKGGNSQKTIVSEIEENPASKKAKKTFSDGIPECGADALRFALLSLNTSKHFVNFNLNDCFGNKLFCNKIWQAQRFASIWAQKLEIPAHVGSFQMPDKLAMIDRWIMSELSAMVASVNAGLENNEFFASTSAIRMFLHGSLCDVYIEAIKPKLYAGTAEAVASCRILLHCLDVSLRCLAPFMPFVTETLYATLPCRNYETIDSAAFPSDSILQDDDLRSVMNFALKVTHSIRQMKSERGVLKRKLKVYIETDKQQQLNDAVDVIGILAWSEVFLVPRDSFTSENAIRTAVDTSTSIFVEIDSLETVNSEQVQKRRIQLEADLAKLEAQLLSDGSQKRVSERVRKNLENRLVKLKADLARISSF